MFTVIKFFYYFAYISRKYEILYNIDKQAEYLEK
jgi:hypothetical protein